VTKVHATEQVVLADRLTPAAAIIRRA